MGRKKERKITKHHIRPTSRGGDNDEKNIVHVDQSFHRAWHTCFGNMDNADIMTFIHIVILPHHTWTHDLLEQLRQGLVNDDHVQIYNAIKGAEDG